MSATFLDVCVLWYDCSSVCVVSNVCNSLSFFKVKSVDFFGAVRLVRCFLVFVVSLYIHCRMCAQDRHRARWRWYGICVILVRLWRQLGLHFGTTGHHFGSTGHNFKTVGTIFDHVTSKCNF